MQNLLMYLIWHHWMEIEVSLHVQVGEFVESKYIQRGVPSLSWNAFDFVLNLERECDLYNESAQNFE